MASCRAADNLISCKFISLPHEGYSGRIYRKDIPVFIGEGFNNWLKKEML